MQVQPPFTMNRAWVQSRLCERDYEAYCRVVSRRQHNEGRLVCHLNGHHCMSTAIIASQRPPLQVEQPFEITPMTRICNVVMFNIEEAISIPPEADE